MPDVAVHSDFLIHWTGQDLDARDEPGWEKLDSSQLKGKTKLVEAYLGRLRSILEYGLWLTTEPEAVISTGRIEATIPSTPKVCFTELKLSESRVHAKRYGRLGIGVKRPYLLNRAGRAVAYVCYDFERQKDPLFAACARDLVDPSLLNFFKPMNSARPLNYDFYGESEWRIIFLECLLRDGLLIDPRDSKNVKEHAYFHSLSAGDQERLGYLAPLDGWLAMLIYPSTSVKNAAQDESTGIRSELRRIKSNPDDHGNQVEGGSWPIELNLDACRNF